MDWVALWITNWWSVGGDSSNNCGEDGDDGKLHLENFGFFGRRLVERSKRSKRTAYKIKILKEWMSTRLLERMNT
jgi:hypothetical protein